MLLIHPTDGSDVREISEQSLLVLNMASSSAIAMDGSVRNAHSMQHSVIPATPTKSILRQGRYQSPSVHCRLSPSPSTPSTAHSDDDSSDSIPTKKKPGGPFSAHTITSQVQQSMEHIESIFVDTKEKLRQFDLRAFGKEEKSVNSASNSVRGTKRSYIDGSSYSSNAAPTGDRVKFTTMGSLFAHPNRSDPSAPSSPSTPMSPFSKFRNRQTNSMHDTEVTVAANNRRTKKNDWDKVFSLLPTGHKSKMKDYLCQQDTTNPTIVVKNDAHSNRSRSMWNTETGEPHDEASFYSALTSSIHSSGANERPQQKAGTLSDLLPQGCAAPQSSSSPDELMPQACTGPQSLSSCNDIVKNDDGAGFNTYSLVTVVSSDSDSQQPSQQQMPSLMDTLSHDTSDSALDQQAKQSQGKPKSPVMSLFECAQNSTATCGADQFLNHRKEALHAHNFQVAEVTLGSMQEVDDLTAIMTESGDRSDQNSITLGETSPSVVGNNDAAALISSTLDEQPIHMIVNTPERPPPRGMYSPRVPDGDLAKPDPLICIASTQSVHSIEAIPPRVIRQQCNSLDNDGWTDVTPDAIFSSNEFGQDRGVTGPSIHFYGREQELSALKTSYLRSKNATTGCEIAVLEGVAGVGKTAICEHFFINVEDSSSVLARGGFEPPVGSSPDIHPFSPICFMFSKLFRRVLQEDENWAKEHLSPDLQVVFQQLCCSFEEFQSLCPPEQDWMDECRENGTALKRLDVTLRNLLRVICQTHQVILWMDNLQWMSPQCSAVLETILSDPQGRHLLFVGTRRPDNYLLGRKFERFQDRKENVPFPVPVDNLIQVCLFDFESVGKLLLQQFEGFDEVKVLSLGDQLHEKTKGNAFLMFEFINLIYATGLVKFKPEMDRWEWSIEPVLMKTEFVDHAFTLVSEIVDCRTSHKIRAILMIASLLGSTTFHTDTLHQVIKTTQESNRYPSGQNGCLKNKLPSVESELDLEEMLRSAVHEGLLEKLKEPRTYRFSRTIFWESLRAIMLKDLNSTDRSYLHGFISQRLQANIDVSSNTAEITSNQALQTVFHHTNYETVSVVTDQESVSFAELHILAAQAAIQVWAFENAVEYLEKATTLINASFMSPWSSCYETMLRLATTQAKAYISAKMFQKGQNAATEAISQSSSLGPKYQMYQLLIRSYVSQGRYEEAMTANLDFLDELNFSLPRKLPKILARKMLPKTKKLLSKMSSTRWENIEECDDEAINAAHSMLFLLVDVATKAGNSNYRLLAMMMGVQAVWDHGSSSWVAVALACGSLTMLKAGEVDEAQRYCNMCLRYINDRPQNCYQNRQALSLLYSYAHDANRSVQDELDGLAFTYVLSLQAGDFEAMVSSKIAHSLTAICYGSKLQQLRDEMIQFVSFVEDYGETEQVELLRPVLQLILNLVGEGGQTNSEIFVGCVLDKGDEKMIQQHSKVHDNRSMYCLRVCKMVQAYLTDSKQMSQQMSLQLESSSFKVNSAAWQPMEYLFHGLIAFKLGQQRRGQKWMNRLETRVEKGNHGCSVALALLKAVSSARQPTVDAAVTQGLFDSAITLAEQDDNCLVAALGNELAAKYFLKLRRQTSLKTSWASVYLQRSYSFYARWGAAAKCHQLQTRYFKFVDFSSFAAASQDEPPPTPPRLEKTKNTSRFRRRSSAFKSSSSSINSSSSERSTRSKISGWIKRTKKVGKSIKSKFAYASVTKSSSSSSSSSK